MRIGHGYDVHCLVEGRALVLGGVEIKSDVGTLGHSDGDAAIHALIDAMLGACALGDIGEHFPDNDVSYAGIDSKILLARCNELVSAAGYRLSNADITIILQRPRIGMYKESMRNTLASVLNTDVSNISVKATTEEKLGFTGSGEGVAAHAVVLMEKIII